MMKKIFYKNSVPQISCSVVIILDKRFDDELFIRRLKNLGIEEFTINRPKCLNSVEFSIAKIKNESSWELDYVLNKMFFKIENCIKELNDLIKQFDAEVYIDIVFYHFGTYPALIISEESINKIYYMNASVGIDPYKGYTIPISKHRRRFKKTKQSVRNTGDGSMIDKK